MLISHSSSSTVATILVCSYLCLSFMELGPLSSSLVLEMPFPKSCTGVGLDYRAF